MIARLALACALAAGCYSPTIADGQFMCADNACPSGFDCRCGRCRPSSTTGCLDVDGGGDLNAFDMRADDLNMSVDSAMPDLASGPPCTNGMRLAGITAMGVALCPAAWKVPGISNAAAMATPCNRHPTPDGTNGAGTDCSAVDNCGGGWHVCADESELQSKGFTSCSLSAIANAGNNLWLTREKADVNMMSDLGPPPLFCGSPNDHIVVGCGTIGGPSPSSGCTILNHSLATMPGGSDQCAASTGNVFFCAGVNPAGGTPEAYVVTKPGVSGGGVMCCHD